MSLVDDTGLVPYSYVALDVQELVRALPLEKYFVFDQAPDGSFPIYEILTKLYLSPLEGSPFALLAGASAVNLPSFVPPPCNAFLVESFNGASYNPESWAGLTLRLRYLTDVFNRQTAYELFASRAEIWRVIRMISVEYHSAYVSTDFQPSVHDFDDDQILDLLRAEVQGFARELAVSHLQSLKAYLGWNQAGLKRVEVEMADLKRKVGAMADCIRLIGLYDESYDLDVAKNNQSFDVLRPVSPVSALSSVLITPVPFLQFSYPIRNTSLASPITAMPAHRSTSPDFIILSTDPATSSPLKNFRFVGGHMSTGGPARLRAQAAQKLKAAKVAKSAVASKPMHVGYHWPARAILEERKLEFKIDYRPAFLTPAEYDFWSVRDHFLSESKPVLRGRVRVVFAPSWQRKSYASVLLQAKWDARWEKLALSSDEL
ncbi:hypothetical protein P7C70_g3637, partial [Phenoliferia sp. Uapishka_3]